MNRSIINSEYLTELLRLTKKAKKEIILVNYLAELHNRKGKNPIYMLSRELIGAIKRGVKVQIVLEGSKLNQNYHFYRYMKDNGADVWLDTSSTFIHQKTALIDGKYFIVGSHNLTWGAMSRSEEFALLTDNKQSIKNYLRRLKEITRQRDKIYSSICREGIRLPASILVHVEGEKPSGIVPTLLTKHGKNLFDLYFTLCLEDKGRPKKLKVDYRRWGGLMGLDPADISPTATADYRRRFFKRRVGDSLEKLDDLFGWVDYDSKKGTVKRRALAPHPQKIVIPLTYWKYGWNTRLCFSSKYFYLVSLFETQISPSRPWWRLSNKDLTRKYKISKRPLGRALPELTKYGLLEILEDTPKRKGEHYYMEPFYYRHNPFYPI